MPWRNPLSSNFWPQKHGLPSQKGRISRTCTRRLVQRTIELNSSISLGVLDILDSMKAGVAFITQNTSHWALVSVLLRQSAGANVATMSSSSSSNSSNSLKKEIGSVNKRNLQANAATPAPPFEHAGGGAGGGSSGSGRSWIVGLGGQSGVLGTAGLAAGGGFNNALRSSKAKKQLQQQQQLQQGGDRWFHGTMAETNMPPDYDFKGSTAANYRVDGRLVSRKEQRYLSIVCVC